MEVPSWKGGRERLDDSCQLYITETTASTGTPGISMMTVSESFKTTTLIIYLKSSTMYKFK